MSAGQIEGLLGLANVRDYGARGDGQTNDTPRIHDAILALPAAGGTVVFPAGAYFLATNVTFQGRTNVTFWLLAGASFVGPGALPANAGTNRVFDMSFAAGSFPPSGPAGGALAGVYPNPGLAAPAAPTAQAFGDAAAVGAAGLAADGAHRHGMPGAPAAMQQGVNNGQEVWQRGNGPFTLNNAYAADRWQLIIAGTDTLSVSKDTTAANKLANSGAASTLTFTLGTGAGASRYKQRLVIADGYQHLLGQPFSVRAPSRGNAAAAVRAFVTTDGTGGTTTFSGFHSGGGAFENLDIANVVVPADATFVEYGVALAATVTVSLDNVMPTATSTPQPFSGLTPAEDLARCLRYYQRFDANSSTTALLAVGYCIAANQAIVLVPMLAKMAGTPTLTLSAQTHFTVISASNQPCTALVAYSAHPDHYSLLATVGAGLVAGNGCALQVNTTAAWLALEVNP